MLAAFLTALALFAAMMVPSELLRLFAAASVRHRVFEPRLTRRGALPSVVRHAPRLPFAWLWVAWTTDDTAQAVVDGAWWAGVAPPFARGWARAASGGRSAGAPSCPQPHPSPRSVALTRPPVPAHPPPPRPPPPGRAQSLAWTRLCT